MPIGAFRRKAGYKYETEVNVEIRKADTLLDEQLDKAGGHYTKVIGNPPYGAWQDYEKRDALKKKYPGQYVKETYSLFLLRCLSVLRMHGRLSFIVPDTWLFLHMHSFLREVLLTRTKVEEILIFPSRFFPGISFGYSSLSIITLERCPLTQAQENTIRIIRGFQSPSEFQCLFDSQVPGHLQEFFLKQKDVFDNDHHRFVITKDPCTGLLSKKTRVLGDVAHVVTGFCTGDNGRFIKTLNGNRGGTRYGVIDETKIFKCTSLQGIPNVPEGYIPYLKGSSTRRYLHQDQWYVRWDEDTVKTYHTSKRARFQNSGFYFQPGVGIPMVKSGALRAFLMQDRVFDQSIVGIFPRDGSKLWYLLVLMNSDVANRLIHSLNPTANNSANYVKQLPYLEPDQETLELISQKVREIISAVRQNDERQGNELHQQISALIGEVYTEALET